MTAAEFLKANLICPKDATALVADDRCLKCGAGHSYPIVDGVPVLLADNLSPTHAACAQDVVDAPRSPPSQVETSEVDPYVQAAVVNTCGHLYRPLLGRLERYPIPVLDSPLVADQVFLDVGANWGRWCFAAAARGFTAIGVDPDLEAARAGNRIAAQLGCDAAFVVADARALPLRASSIHMVHSYSVLQHFAPVDVRAALVEFARVAAPGGSVLVQIANRHGPLQLLRRLQHRKSGDIFRVRHWTPREIADLFQDTVGLAEVTADGYFTLNPQAADLDMLTRRHRAVVRTSLTLTRASRKLRWLVGFADSLYVRANRLG